MTPAKTFYTTQGNKFHIISILVLKKHHEKITTKQGKERKKGKLTRSSN